MYDIPYRGIVYKTYDKRTFKKRGSKQAEKD